MSTQVIVAFITGVLGPLIVLYFKNRWEKNSSKDVIRETLKLSELVTTKIEQIKEEFEADRVWIAQFHNGGNFYPTGKSMAKFSIIYEVVGLNTISIQNNFQNIPVNLFSKAMNQLLVEDVISISDFKDETIATYGLKYVAEETGCKSAYIFSIKTIEDKFIGLIGIDYTQEPVVLDENTIHHATNRAAALGGVLSDGLKK